jgi:hypothetical protein
LVLGGLITYVDSRPNWDDTGVTAMAILVATGVLGFVDPSRPWLWAVAVGLWIPALGIVQSQNYGSLLALLIAFVGAYAGMALRRGMMPVEPSQKTTQNVIVDPVSRVR